MPLKIICLEEHLVSPALAAATMPTMREQAPYFADLGSHYQEDPSTQPQDRPRLTAPKQALKAGAAPVEERLAAMDAAGIDVQVLSYPHPTQAAPPDVARRANDELAETVAAHPGRLAGFSTLPWQDVDAAIEEAERSATQLGLTATLLSGHPGENSFVDDPHFTLLLAKLAELQVPLYLHPGPPLPAVQRPYYSGFSKETTARLSLYGYGWHNEAGIQVLRLILSGTLDAHPNLRLISGHWGEMVPFFLQRLDDALPPEVTGLSRTISQTYRDQVYVTPSGMLYGSNFRFCQEVLGIERILFAVDYPYLTLTGARAWLEALPVSEAERTAIAHGNAERLLRLASS